MKTSVTKMMALAALAAGVAMVGSRAEAASLPGQNGLRPAVDALALIESVQVFVYGGRRTRIPARSRSAPARRRQDGDRSDREAKPLQRGCRPSLRPPRARQAPSFLSRMFS